MISIMKRISRNSKQSTSPPFPQACVNPSAICNHPKTYSTSKTNKCKIQNIVGHLAMSITTPWVRVNTDKIMMIMLKLLNSKQNGMDNKIKTAYGVCHG
jgi:hypothetical protein